MPKIEKFWTAVEKIRKENIEARGKGKHCGKKMRVDGEMEEPKVIFLALIWVVEQKKIKECQCYFDFGFRL